MVLATRHRHRKKKKKREDRPFKKSKRRQVFPLFRTEDVIVPSTFLKDMYYYVPCHVKIK